MKVRARSSAAFRVEAFRAAWNCSGAEWEITVMRVPEGLSVGCCRWEPDSASQYRGRTPTRMPLRRRPRNQFPGPKLDHWLWTAPPLGARAGGVRDDNSEMGADLLSGVGRRRHSRVKRHFGGLSRRRPLPVLCFCRDLPGPADPRSDNIQSLGISSRVRLVSPLPRS